MTTSSQREATASAYCFDLSGRLRWRYAAPPNRNLGWLGWDQGTSEWIGIQHDVELRIPDALIRWDMDGVVILELSVGRASDYVFLPSGRLLVTANGRVLDARTAVEIAHFPFVAIEE